jgi:hypothetical protein
MAATKTRSKKSNRSSRNGRSASQKPERYRFAQNVDGAETIAEHVYRTYVEDALAGKADTEPDVLVDVPVVKVDSIHLELDNLAASVSLQAKVLELVDLEVGVDVALGKVRLDVKGVEAQALLKVRLDYVSAIVDRVLTTVDRNPELVESIGRAIERVGEGTGHTLADTGEGVEDVGEGTEKALAQVGEGAGSAVQGIGQGTGEAAGNLDQVLAQAAHAGGGAAGGGQGDGSGGGNLGEIAALVQGDHGTRARKAAKLTAKELGAAASEKVKEIGSRRRQRQAEEHDATERAFELAKELDVDLDEVDGSGAEGRITVKDVRAAAADR